MKKILNDYFKPNPTKEIPVTKPNGKINIAGIMNGNSVNTKSTGLDSGLLQKAVEQQQRDLLEKQAKNRNEIHSMSNSGSGISDSVIQMNSEISNLRKDNQTDNTRGELFANMF